MIKIATYTTREGKDLQVEYDSKAPCIMCGLPVEEASMGGTAICPWCDMGIHRDGSEITFRELIKMGNILAEVGKG